MGGRLGRIEGLPIIIVAIVVTVVFMALAPQTFLSARIYATLLVTMAPLLLCALGLTLVIA